MTEIIFISILIGIAFGIGWGFAEAIMKLLFFK